MMSEEIAEIQHHHLCRSGSQITINWRMSGLVVKLIEITHGQWIYRNLQVHDAVTGELVTKKKEELQAEIEKQMELGNAGLLPKNKFLAEVNLQNLENSSGERQFYWLVTIQEAQRARLVVEGHIHTGK